MENTKLYAAYGSNMNIEQMRRRCPGARVVGSAYIYGYRLIFRGTPHMAVATIERARDTSAQVPLLLWTITPSDERKLDQYEGYPQLYEKRDICIQTANGEKKRAMAYIMTPGRQENAPSLLYCEVIRQGYVDAGIEDDDTLKRAIQRGVRATRAQTTIE